MYFFLILKLNSSKLIHSEFDIKSFKKKKGVNFVGKKSQNDIDSE